MSPSDVTEVEGGYEVLEEESTAVEDEIHSSGLWPSLLGKF